MNLRQTPQRSARRKTKEDAEPEENENEADDDDELEQALAQLGGNISRPVRELRDQLLHLTSHLEAGLDW